MVPGTCGTDVLGEGNWRSGEEGTMVTAMEPQRTPVLEEWAHGQHPLSSHTALLLSWPLCCVKTASREEQDN